MTNKNKYPKIKAIGSLYRADGSEDDDYSDDDYEDDYDAENYDNGNNSNDEFTDPFNDPNGYYDDDGDFVDSFGNVYDENGDVKGYYDDDGDFVDPDGIVYGSDGEEKGYYDDDGDFVDPDGKVYGTDGELKGYYDDDKDFVDTDGLVYGSDGEFKGYYDKNGNFVDLDGVTYNSAGEVIEDKATPNPPCPQVKTERANPKNNKQANGANIGSPQMKKDAAKAAVDLAKKKLESFTSKGLPTNRTQNSQSIYNDKVKQLQNDLAKAQEQAKAVGVTPSWVLPVSIIGGILIVGLIVIIVVKNKK